jgi:hypothetical protein
MALMSLRDRLAAAARPVGFAAILLAVSSAPARGQASTPPATAGSGTIALEGSMRKFYRGANIVVVATVDGVEHAFAFTRDLIVHGGKRPGPDALSGLQSGAMVVVHYTVSGATASATEVDVIGVDGLKIVEGRVVHIDRRKGQITLKYDDGTEEQFLLTEHAVTETTQPGVPADGAQVTIYYTDDIGRKVIHYFKQTP